MAFDGNGTFNRIMSWVTDAAAKVKIKADRHDQQDDDFAAGLTNCITKDGQTSPTNHIPMNGKRLLNLGDPTDSKDAATKAYVDAIKIFSTGLEISGADANGQLKFSSTTGANGLAFVGADLTWLARLADATATPPKLNRLVLNDKPDGSGADVFTVNDDGSAVAGKKFTSPLYEVKAATGPDLLNFLSSDGASVFMALSTPATAQGDGSLIVKDKTFVFNVSGQIKAPGAVFAGAAYLDTNGQIVGSAYGGALTTWVSNLVESRSQAWANDRIANLQYRRVSEGAVTFGSGRQTAKVPGGAVQTGVSAMNNNIDTVYYMYLQVYDPVRGWVGFQG